MTLNETMAMTFADEMPLQSSVTVGPVKRQHEPFVLLTTV